MKTKPDDLKCPECGNTDKETIDFDGFYEKGEQKYIWLCKKTAETM